MVKKNNGIIFYLVFLVLQKKYYLGAVLILRRPREEGRRFELFWWISHPNYCVYILVIKPKYKRDLVV